MKDFEAIYQERQLSLASSGHSAQVVESIARFLNSLQAQGVSTRRLVKYAGHFMKLGKMISKPLDEMGGEDIDRLLIVVNKAPGWSPWTKHDYQLCLKKFFKFIDGNESRAGRIKILTPAPKTIDEKACLTSFDVSKLEAASRDVRSKTIIRVLFESGMRQAEFLGLKVGDVSEQPPFVIFNVHGQHLKNAHSARRIPIDNPRALALLREYLAMHPHKDDPNAALWVGFKGEPLEPRNLDKMLRRAGAKAGVTKRVNPHWFRHSCVTQMKSRIHNLEPYFGWAKGSRMLQTYDHSGLNALMDELGRSSPVSEEASLDATVKIISEAINKRPELLLGIAKALAEDGKINVLESVRPRSEEQGAAPFPTTPWPGLETFGAAPYNPGKLAPPFNSATDYQNHARAANSSAPGVTRSKKKEARP